jgi:hypothetical protein
VELTSSQALRQADVTDSERAAISKAIAAQLRPAMADLSIQSEQQLHEIALDAAIKMVDLNGDGTPEVIVQGMGPFAGCSPTGNCPFWVFQRSDGAYKLLSHEPSVQTFTVRRSRTHGFSDLVLATHESAKESILTVLRYHDGRYRKEGCYDARWFVVEGDTIRELKEPQLTPCGER